MSYFPPRSLLAGLLSASALAGCLGGSAPRAVISCVNQADGTDCTTGLCCHQACANFESDANNCGSCGFICPNHEICAGGSCLTCAQLDAGTPCQDPAFGSGLCCGGACANIAADALNCNGCGNVCPASQTCVDAGCVNECGNQPNNTVCTIATPDDGICCSQVCVNAGTDPSNCFNCGTVCGPNQKCNGGICG